MMNIILRLGFRANFARFSLAVLLNDFVGGLSPGFFLDHQ